MRVPFGDAHYFSYIYVFEWFEQLINLNKGYGIKRKKRW